MTRRLNALLATAMMGGLLMAAAAQAQPAPAGQPGEMRHEDMRRAERDPAAHLRALLQLRPGQEPALQAFVAATHHAHGDKPPGMDRDAWPKTTPERLHVMEARMTDGAAKMHEHIEATLAFYSQLDPAQKRAFDEMPMHGHGGGMHGHMGGHGGMGEDRMGPPPGA